MFFIYDQTRLKKEEDDLKDAILFFYPQSTSTEIQCGICGQLMGIMMLFKNVMGCYPKVFKTKNQSFAVIHLKRYIMALSGDFGETFTMKQLEYFYSLIIFYQQSLENFFQNEMTHVERCKLFVLYLNFVEHFGNKVTAAFHSLPFVELPQKDGGNLLLQSKHLLEHCTNFFPVYGGCILYKNSILCTDFDPDITFRLLLIGSHVQQKNGNDGEEMEKMLPDGVHTRPIFLTRKEFEPLKNKCDQIHSSESNNLRQNPTFKNKTETKHMDSVDECQTFRDIQGTNCEKLNNKNQLENSDGNENKTINSSDRIQNIGDKSCDDCTQIDREEHVSALLYAQGNSEMLLLLLMENNSTQSQSVLQGLWKCIFPKLAELDVSLQMCCQKVVPKKPMQEVLSYNYLQFDGLKRSLSGKIAVSEKSQKLSSDESHFCETAVNLHNIFLQQPSMKDCTLRNANNVIYGQRMMLQETYFQKAFSHINSEAPSEKDNTLLVDKRAKDRLCKDQGINII